MPFGTRGGKRRLRPAAWPGASRAGPSGCLRSRWSVRGSVGKGGEDRGPVRRMLARACGWGGWAVAPRGSAGSVRSCRLAGNRLPPWQQTERSRQYCAASARPTPRTPPRMRPSYSLLTASAVLLGALAVGNPLLPRRGEVEAAGSKASTTAALVRRDGARPRFGSLWAKSPLPHSPKDLLERLPVLVTPTVMPASWQRPVPAREDAALPAIDFQRPQ